MARRTKPPPNLAAYTTGIQTLLNKAPAGLIKSYSWLDLSAKQAPWVESDIVLAEGDEVSCFIEGRIYANKLLDIHLPLEMQIWCKLGGGDIFRGTQPSHSFVAQHPGTLQFGNYFPNDWQTPMGDRQQDDKIYSSSTGEAKILIIRWAASALEGLKQLQRIGDYNDKIQAAIAHLERGRSTPTGWDHLWNIDPSDIYKDYKHYMGEPPARIVKVWLITNSVFQRNTENCDYSNIIVNQGETNIQVL